MLTQFSESSISIRRKTQGNFQGPSDQRQVHGISVSKKSGTAIRKEQVREGVAIANRYLAAAKSLSLSSLEAVAYLRSRIPGWRYYCNQAEYGPVKAIRQKLEAGDRHVLQILKRNQLSCKKEISGGSLKHALTRMFRANWLSFGKCVPVLRRFTTQLC